MTEAELIQLIETKNARAVLNALSALDEADRRRLAKPVGTLFRHWYDGMASLRPAKEGRLKVSDEDGLRVALLATASLTELKRYRFHAIPWELPLTDVMRALKPTWLDRWVSALIEDNPALAVRLEPLWTEGLCARPAGDALVLGYYAYQAGTALDLSTPGFLDRDVWRFFEVEGGGDMSLAAHDKYTTPEGRWSTILVGLCEEGTLDRERLLDASLDALERDFGQFRAGWYARFHTALAPTLDEQAARAERYLQLLTSARPPTVSFALKALKAMDKAKRLAPGDLLPALAPALQARHKSTVTSALQLLASAARQAPACAPPAARLAATALISEASDVQGRALDLIERLDAAGDGEVRASLEDHAAFVAPSLRKRIAALIGSTDAVVPEGVHSDAGPADTPTATRLAPVASADDALAAYLEVLESARSPFAVERAMDGLARFGAALHAAGDALSPLAKRARQIAGKRDVGAIRFTLAATGCAWSEATPLTAMMTSLCDDDPHGVSSSEYHANTFAARAAETLARVQAGHALPMLSYPSDTRGRVSPEDLVTRAAAYRDQGIEPGPTDLGLALLRLDGEGREAARARLTPRAPWERALAFALGADETPQGDAGLWVAAWAARDPQTSHAGVSALVGAPLPDAGMPASYELVVERQGDRPHVWYHIRVQVSPAAGPRVSRFLTSRFHLPHEHRWRSANPCGWHAADVAWASLVWPANLEPFFSRALLAMDTDETLSDHPGLAYLEPLLRPGTVAGPLAHATLALYLASTDKAVVALAEEAVAAQVTCGALDAATFATAVRQFLASETLPTGRWTRAFGAIAALSPVHGAFVGAVIARLLGSVPGTPPRDVGGMIELLFELHTAAGTVLEDTATRQCLERMSGGKAGRFARKLLALSAAA